MQIIDLTRTFDHIMPVYPGDPPATLTQVASVEKDGFTDHVITSGMHVGTHLDAPLHMVAGGRRIPELPLDAFFGKGYLLDARDQREISAEILRNYVIPADAIVLVWTGFDQYFRETKYYSEHPVLTHDFTQAIIDTRIKMVGMDLPSPDFDPFPIHKMMLKSGVLLLENLTNLKALEGITNFEVIALPMKFDSEGAFARVVARIIL